MSERNSTDDTQTLDGLLVALKAWVEAREAEQEACPEQSEIPDDIPDDIPRFITRYPP